MTQRTDHTIRELQINLPWTIRYSREFRANPQPHKDFAHALTHVGKAAGRLHAFVDEMDHDRTKAEEVGAKQTMQAYVADLVICAMRMANTFPGGPIDLQQAVKERLESKNGVKLVPPSVYPPMVKRDPATGRMVLAMPNGEPVAVRTTWPRTVVCPDCDGTGSLPLFQTSAYACYRCMGTGELKADEVSA